MEPSIIFSSKYADQAEKFYEVYEQQDFADCPKSKMKGLKHRSLRVCRFCKKKSGEVKFKKDAHIFPIALGNRYLVSDFECDSCNELFGTYEDDLVKFLGITRTISKTKGRDGIPGFEAKGIRATRETFYGHPDAIKIASTSSPGVFSYDSSTNTHFITYAKPPYTPIKVFKSLLKMALCLVPQDEMKEYDPALRFLLSNELDKHLEGLLAFLYVLPISYDTIFGMLFKKIHPEKNAATNWFVLCYSSYMFQIPLPFNRMDFPFYSKLEVPVFPPMFDGTGADHWQHSSFAIVDLTSIEKKSDDISIMGVQPKVDLQSLVAIDRETGEEVPGTLDPSKIIGVYMVHENFNIDINK